MENVLKVMKKVARTDADVLVIGENGTGKELIVKVHNNSGGWRLLSVSI
jgi:transcriptional regulator with PAS, ATPase and Fis domain